MITAGGVTCDNFVYAYPVVLGEALQCGAEHAFDIVDRVFGRVKFGGFDSAVGAFCAIHPVVDRIA